MSRRSTISAHVGDELWNRAADYFQSVGAYRRRVERPEPPIYYGAYPNGVAIKRDSEVPADEVRIHISYPPHIHGQDGLGHLFKVLSLMALFES